MDLTVYWNLNNMTDIDKICSKKDFITQERYMEVIQPLIDLAVSRNAKYGNSIAIMSDRAIVELIMMKLVRTKTMIDVENPDEKLFDEIGDAINYLVYVLRRFKDSNINIDTQDGDHLK